MFAVKHFKNGLSNSWTGVVACAMILQTQEEKDAERSRKTRQGQKRTQEKEAAQGQKGQKLANWVWHRPGEPNAEHRAAGLYVPPVIWAWQVTGGSV
jgi:hypothetical protein